MAKKIGQKKSLSKRAEEVDDVEDVESDDTQDSDTEDSDENADSDPEESEDDGEFRIVKGRVDKPKQIVTALNFTEAQTKHINSIAKEHGTSRANFVRQTVLYALKRMGRPLPK
jgi:hypothetical protein